MLEVRELDLHYAENLETTRVVCVNSTSLEIMNTCQKKAYYALVRGARKSDEGPALTFGSAIHEGLKSYYLRSSGNRDHAACLDTFESRAWPLKNVPGDEKRSIPRGRAILSNYFNVYKNDPWVVHSDRHGPLIERDFEFTLMTRDKIQVKLFGTIDAVFKHEQTGEIVLVDHKTTSSLSNDFYGKVKPNHQFTGYLLACREVFGLPINTVMMNGIQVAKTVLGLGRNFSVRTESDFEEFRDMVFYRVKEFLDNKKSGNWPMAGYPACVQWGGCQYREVCESHPTQRENVLRSLYPNVTELTK